MWGVPKLEDTLLIWMRSEIKAHIEELTQIAERASFTLYQAEARHRVEISGIRKQHQTDKAKLGLRHEEQLKILTCRIHDLESRFIKDSRNSHKPPSTDGSKKVLRTQSFKREDWTKSRGGSLRKGHFKSLSEQPNTIILHMPQVCRTCKKPLRRSVVIKREGFMASPKQRESLIINAVASARA